MKARREYRLVALLVALGLLLATLACANAKEEIAIQCGAGTVFRQMIQSHTVSEVGDMAVVSYVTVGGAEGEYRFKTADCSVIVRVIGGE